MRGRHEGKTHARQGETHRSISFTGVASTVTTFFPRIILSHMETQVRRVEYETPLTEAVEVRPEGVVAVSIDPVITPPFDESQDW